MQTISDMFRNIQMRIIADETNNKQLIEKEIDNLKIFHQLYTALPNLFQTKLGCLEVKNSTISFGLDYCNVSFMLHFPSTDRQVTVSIHTIRDDKVNGYDNFELTINSNLTMLEASTTKIIQNPVAFQVLRDTLMIPITISNSMLQCAFLKIARNNTQDIDHIRIGRAPYDTRFEFQNCAKDLSLFPNCLVTLIVDYIPIDDTLERQSLNARARSTTEKENTWCFVCEDDGCFSPPAFESDEEENGENDAISEQRHALVQETIALQMCQNQDSLSTTDESDND